MKEEAFCAYIRSIMPKSQSFRNIRKAVKILKKFKVRLKLYYEITLGYEVVEIYVKL
jgi:hypothetical protein